MKMGRLYLDVECLCSSGGCEGMEMDRVRVSVIHKKVSELCRGFRSDPVRE